MIRILSIFIFSFFTIPIMAQEAILDGTIPVVGKPFDFVILVDGKLPSNLTGEFSFFKDTTLHVISFENNYGRMNFLSKDLSVFDSLADSTEINMVIAFEEPVAPYSYKKHLYNLNDQLLFIKKYRVITVANFKKSKTYHIHRIMDFIATTPQWRKEYGCYRKFLKKVYRGVYPRYISKLGKDKPHPVY